MQAMIHVPFKKSSFALSNTFNDGIRRVDYDLCVNIQEESGKRIKRAREDKSLRLKDVCQESKGTLGIQQLSNYEHGRRMVPVEVAKQIAPILDVSPEYILTLTDNQKPDRSECELIALYRACDLRGKTAIIRMAAQEKLLSNKVVEREERRIRDDHYTGPERRKSRH